MKILSPSIFILTLSYSSIAQECKDKDPLYCQKFSEAGYCSNEKYFTLITTNCIASCNICQPDRNFAEAPTESSIIAFTEQNLQELQKYYTFTRPHEVEEYRNQDVLVETTLPSFVTEAFGHDNEAEPKDDVYRPRFVDMINPSTYVDTAPIEYGREEMIKFQRTTTDLESESITEANFHHHPEPSQPTKIYISDSPPVLLPPMRVSPPGYQPDDFDLNKLQATTISIFDSNLAYAKSLQKLYKTYKPSNASTVKVATPKKLVQNVPFKSKRRLLIKNPWQKDALPDFNYQVRISKHEPEAQKVSYPKKAIEERKHVRRASYPRKMLKEKDYVRAPVSKLRHVPTSEFGQENRISHRFSKSVPTRSKRYFRRDKSRKFRNLKKRLKYPSDMRYWPILKNGLAASLEDFNAPVRSQGIIKKYFYT